MGVVTVTRTGEIAIVRVDNPPVNALSQAVRQGIDEALNETEQDDAVKAVALICAGRTFFAGADIREFDMGPLEPTLPDLVNRVELATKPWVAAMHGTALGGGLEVALGCHYRVAVPNACVGLPEVHLGILPGAGGTIRLPRLAGVEFAVDMIASGKPVEASIAAEQGIFDALAPAGAELEAFAIEFVQSIIGRPLPGALSARTIENPPDETWWEEKLAAIKKKARGQLSPVAAAGAVRNGLDKPYEVAQTDERALFIELKEGDQSKAMRHAFFAERETAKIPALKGVEPAKIDAIAVIGGGTMGAGIAAAALMAGYRVLMIERDVEAADTGYHRVIAILEAVQKRGLIDAAKRQHMTSAFAAETGYDNIASADLVIEAVFEDMEAKKNVFKKLDETTRPKAILATNTSYLDVGEIASTIDDPSRVIGLHFFSPAHIMKLVEVIRTAKTSPETLATGFAVTKRLRKVPFLSGVCDGFIGNRILYEYRKVCDRLLLEGAVPIEIDAAMEAFGMAMGPYAMADLAGLDIGWATRKRKGSAAEPDYVHIADHLCELGRFGQKTGAGWFSYKKDPRKGERDPLVNELIIEESINRGITRRSIPAEEIQKAAVTVMAAEGRKILDEGIARRASDIDMVMILGYGFPRWRGGPMFMAQHELI